MGTLIRGAWGDLARGRFQRIPAGWNQLLRVSVWPCALTISRLSRRPPAAQAGVSYGNPTRRAARGRYAPTPGSAESDIHALFCPRDL